MWIDVNTHAGLPPLPLPIDLLPKFDWVKRHIKALCNRDECKLNEDFCPVRDGKK